MIGLRSAKQEAFTIVELLIVIVVIAILAAISTVVYSGAQQRAQNTQTITAVRDWAQIIRLYKVDNGSYPTMVSCLGSGYGRGFSGSETSGGQCRQDSEGVGGISINATFMNLMSSYTNGAAPTPAFILGSSSMYPWFRGAYFYPGYTGSRDRIDFVLAGSSTQCPQIPGLDYGSRSIYTSANSVRCVLYFSDSPF